MGPSVPGLTHLLHGNICRLRSRIWRLNLFDCVGLHVVWLRCAGVQRTTEMIDAVTALMGLMGAGIFLAHAFEGVRSWH
jgi:hypothetical protein